MFTDVISNSDLTQAEKIKYHKLAHIYEDNLPDSLYLNHYELSLNFGHSPSLWNQFLKLREIDRLVQSEIAQIAEIGARRALAKLQSGNFASQDVQAAKELLANSKLIQQNTKQYEKVVLTRINKQQGSEG